MRMPFTGRPPRVFASSKRLDSGSFAAISASSFSASLGTNGGPQAMRKLSLAGVTWYLITFSVLRVPAWLGDHVSPSLLSQACFGWHQLAESTNSSRKGLV